MPEGDRNEEPKTQAEATRKAFEQEFERFARFTDDSAFLAGLDLENALAEQRALADLRTRHLGKKSALAATKKLIGRVAAEDRAAFGQLVQSTEAALIKSLDDAEQNLKRTSKRNASRESIDVTSRGAPALRHRHRSLVRERVEAFRRARYASEDEGDRKRLLQFAALNIPTTPARLSTVYTTTV